MAGTTATENNAKSIEDVLAEEAEAIRREPGLADRLLKDLREKQKEALAAAKNRGVTIDDAKVLRFRMDDDQRNGLDIPPAVVEARNAFYRSLNAMNRAALCCSGGGIRSATFCLGVIQALADHKVTAPNPGPGAAPQQQAVAAQPVAAPLIPLLGCFQFLSTVSGGGYIGSWLSSWLKRNAFDEVVKTLTTRPSGPDVEPPEISWLRAYSNYLTPRLGIASADAWAAVAIFIRNLVLNWFIIIPVVCLALLSLKLTATASTWVAHTVDNSWCAFAILVVAAIFLVLAQRFTNRHRPTRRKPQSNTDERAFLWLDLVWAIASAILVTIFFVSHYFVSGFEGWTASIVQWLGLTDILHWLGIDIKLEFMSLTAVGGLLIFAAGWIAAARFSKGGYDFIAWAASGLVYGALIGLGAYLFSKLGPYATNPYDIRCLLLTFIFGVPWVLMSQLAAEIIFVGLVSYEAESDPDREWLGRAAGWLAAALVAWAIVAFLVFAGEYAVYAMHLITGKALAAAGSVTGIATALLGRSASTRATATSDDQPSKLGILYNIVLAVAGPIFVAALVIGLSIGLDQLLLGDWLVKQLQIPTMMARTILGWLALGWVVTAVAGLASSYFVSINRFSLHALYRNRLIRGYLGASRQERHPDRFTGFDAADNMSVYSLWPPLATQGAGAHCLFHVINIALNVVSTKRLAWQERKAESFTVTPRHCGSAYLGFRPSNEYGERPGRGGITLGTAVAISGAAASPNMGYHSSPSVTLLLALFNVRLGWWLGNPGKHGQSDNGEKIYQTDGPKWAAKPLFYEAFGQTTDQSHYVYLSDGGHFENLALYEVVRRRCRFIVVIDAGGDPDFAFEDLGNAVRKIYIDLGIRIQFRGLENLHVRPEKGASADTPYFAISDIDYEAADGSGPDRDGHILYIKPAYHGVEGAGIRSYAGANKDFPHESTADQWFTESQFESYRSLGLEIANRVLEKKDATDILDAFLKSAGT
jgi:hypothetical protein